MDKEMIDLRAKRLEKRIPGIVAKVDMAVQLLGTIPEPLITAKELLVQVERELDELYIAVGEEENQEH